MNTEKAKVKLLLAYVATTRLMDEFNRVQELQRRFFPEAVVGCERLVVTDAGGWCMQMPTAQCDRLWEKGEFCLGRARNVGLRAAECLEVDWCLLLDADVVLVQGPQRYPEETGLSAALGFWLKEGEDLAAADLKDKGRWAGTGLPLVSRRHFGRRFWDQPGRGEEIDFFQRVMGCVKQAECGARVAHMWHPRREWRKG